MPSEATNMKFVLDSIGNQSFRNLSGSWETTSDQATGTKYQGIGAKISTYSYQSSEMSFSCEYVIFTQPGSLTVPPDNETVEVFVGTMKYSTTIKNGFAVDSDASDTLTVCVNLFANGHVELSDEWTQDATSFKLAGEYRVENGEHALCGDERVDVAASRRGNTVCYEFSRCEGDIWYDPFVYYEGEGHETGEQKEGGGGLMDEMALYVIVGCAVVCMCLAGCMVAMFCCNKRKDHTNVDSATYIETGHISPSTQL